MTPEEAAREIHNKVMAAHCAHESRATDCIRCADIVHEKMTAIIRQAIEAEREECAKTIIASAFDDDSGRDIFCQFGCERKHATAIRARSSEPAKSGEKA